jgi:CxxC-x17-CxxC domain-containing protein
MPNHKIYLKLMINGVASKAFSADTLSPLSPEETSYDKEIIEASRKKYSIHVHDVEAAITEWSGMIKPAEQISASGENSGGESGSKKKKKSKLKLFDTICSKCGKKTEVPFEPDPTKDVYCKECFDLLTPEEKEKRKQEIAADKKKAKEDTSINKDEEKSKQEPVSVSETDNKNTEKEELSLSSAFEKEPVKFSGPKSENGSKDDKHGPDIEGLRSILKEIVDEPQGNKPAKKEPENKSGVLHPGDSVKFS